MVRRWGRPRWVGISAASVLVALACACGGPGSPARPEHDALGDGAITVASFDFPESRLLADIYGRALEQAGYDIRDARGLGPRELVEPALARGLVEFVPEYAGTALEFLSLGASHPSADVVATHAALIRTLRDGRLTALDAAPAQNANAVVVTRSTATKYDLRTIDDLVAVAPHLTFGGPPECPTRPFCLAGLRRTYGLEFDSFLGLDAGGPLTRQALAASEVDVAVLFTTDPHIASDDLVVLADDRGLQPAENVTPFVNRAVVERFGPAFEELVDSVSARLTTEELQALNGRVADGERSTDVARDWVENRRPT